MNDIVSSPAPAPCAPGTHTTSTTAVSFNIRWLGLTWEVAAIWYVILVVACVSALAVFDSARVAELDGVRRERLSLFLSDLREKIETDIRLGFDMGEDRGAQARIDELIRKDKSLRSIEIFDISGKSRANTDRGSIGESVSPEWLQAMNVTSSALWTFATKDEVVLGLPLKGGFGEISGQIAVTYAPLAHGTGNADIGHHKNLGPLFVVLILIFFLPFLVTFHYVCAIEHQELILTGERRNGRNTDDLAWTNVANITTTVKSRLQSVMQQLDKSR
jgi:hypothetical protein